MELEHVYNAMRAYDDGEYDNPFLLTYGPLMPTRVQQLQHFIFTLDRRRIPLKDMPADIRRIIINHETSYFILTMKNYHILKVSVIPSTPERGTYIKVTSERFRQSRRIWFHVDYPQAVDSAAEWLKSNGFNIIGQGEGSKHMYLIVDDRDSDTFRELPKGNVSKSNN